MGERVEEGKDGRRQGGEDKGTEGWGGKVGRDCAVLKIPLKSHGPRPSLSLRQIDALVQTCICNMGPIPCVLSEF